MSNVTRVGYRGLTMLSLTNVESANDVSSTRKEPWPIHGGHSQPSRKLLCSMRARNFDRLYVNSWRTIKWFAISIPHLNVNQAAGLIRTPS